jgi:hypothetical protein
VTPDLAGIHTLDQLKSLSAEQLRRLLGADAPVEHPRVPDMAGKSCEARPPRLMAKSLPRRASCAAREDCDSAPSRLR